eukprot:TRINITY_DN2357_c2_g1_i2.p1 TRINITY_DN2357_c2_g1~~TRINITY_DN2357_c2_g1_i2.p1  ORF type:complete len:434 (-),score=106.92 TRINITY_DN2357_c2_g1_i2:116-1417(-)
MLLETPNIEVNKPDLIGQTPLIFATKLVHQNEKQDIEHRLITSLLLSRPELDMNCKDAMGITPLMYSVIVKDYKLVKCLLDTRADPNACSIEGTTALHLASEFDYRDLITLLLDYGAVPKPNVDGKFPADFAREYWVKEMLSGKNTSERDPLKVDFIDKKLCPVLGESIIGMSMCPGRQFHKHYSRNLDLDLQVYKDNRVEVVVTLMTNAELDRMKLSNLTKKVEEYGMESLHFPVTDKWIPESAATFARVVQNVVEYVKLGKKIVVHCNGGKGRTGMLIVGTLMQLGMNPITATQAIRSVRPGMLYNPVQQMFLMWMMSSLKEQERSRSLSDEWEMIDFNNNYNNNNMTTHMSPHTKAAATTTTTTTNTTTSNVNNANINNPIFNSTTNYNSPLLTSSTTTTTTNNNTNNNNTTNPPTETSFSSTILSYFKI